MEMGSYRPRFIAMRQQRDNFGLREGTGANSRRQSHLLAVCFNLSLFSLNLYAFLWLPRLI